ncbi:MAG: RNA 2',3'-cyclic phosphodiesterase [Clostridia bacterium]|nr:RNA 2',3'-cyclic phosphodiesterase [Clostridia bacterium]
MRLFLAVWLSKELQKVVGDWLGRITAGSSGVKWVPPGQLHFTLKFLGEQSPEFVTGFSPHLRRVAAAASPFPLSLAGGGAFPGRRSPRVLWLGVDEGRQELAALAGRIETAAAEAAPHVLAPEKRDFKPHLTVGRVKSEVPLFNWGLLETGVEGRMIVKGFSLVESRLTPHGPVYRDLEEYFLCDPL